MSNQSPVIVLQQNMKRETGRKAQLSNIQAGRAVADIVRSTLGPRAMLKMILDAMGGLAITSDSNALLREIDVAHPAAKSMIDLSRAQDEEVGDGTTSVIVLAGEMLVVSEQFLVRNIHPKLITEGYMAALQDALKKVESLAVTIDVNDRERMLNLIGSAVGTKFSHRWGSLMCGLALDAVQTVTIKRDGSPEEVDIKRYAKVEKLPGGELEDSKVLKGVMINKDIVHSRMRRRIENPRVMLLDSPLEYRKGESQTNVEVKNEDDWEKLLQIEEEAIQKMCAEILEHKPDIVITEKGCSDLAQHYLLKANISVIRRLRKTDNNRIARATGATIINRTDDIQASDVGTQCGLFEVRKIGDEYFSFFVDCESPKACTILLRGASKDVLNEVERNLQDAMNVARNIVYDPRIVPGGGAVEMAVAGHLRHASKAVEGVQQWPYREVASAFECIPRTLLQNCGADVIRRITELRAKHAQEGCATWGVNGHSGDLADMNDLGIWEPYLVKIQTFKTAVEAACLLLRIDSIVSGVKKAGPAGGGGGGGGAPPPGMGMGM